MTDFKDHKVLIDTVIDLIVIAMRRVPESDRTRYLAALYRVIDSEVRVKLETEGKNK